MLWRNQCARIVLTDEVDHPGFLRVIAGSHVREMTDLRPPERDLIMRAVFAAESALREVMAPDKINLASLGNAVPHIHWHVVPRFRDDPHFPNSVWGHRVRDSRKIPPGDLVEKLKRALASALNIS